MRETKKEQEVKMNNYSISDHAFVICAYKESQYLEECILSLLRQKVQSRILLVTSTPNDFIKSMVIKYHLECHINYGESGIAQDWNFGLRMASSKLVTIAHQDDIYEPAYLDKILTAINKHEKPLIAFSNYGELREGKKVTKNRLLQIKRLMLFALKMRYFQENRFIRKRILSMGSAICCPSVTMVLDNIEGEVFAKHFRSNVDWQAWARIANQKGAFVYCSDILMYHRIHKESETSKIISDNNRCNEDYEMFQMFWPSWIANILCKIYKKGEDSNYVG